MNCGLPTLDGRRAQSCMLPCSSLGTGSGTATGTSYQEFSRSVSMDLAARVSATGGELEGQPAKRPCYDLSNNSGSDASNAAHILEFNAIGAVVRAEQQQRQGPDAAQLGVWFASQQRQQQLLQLQMQANMQMQQQVQMQMHQQMAAHMSMQQGAGQFLHLQAPALSAPYAAAAAAGAAAAGAAAAVMQAPAGGRPPHATSPANNRSSTASPVAVPSSIVPRVASAAGNPALGSAWAAWQLAPAAAAAAAAGSGGDANAGATTAATAATMVAAAFECARPRGFCKLQQQQQVTVGDGDCSLGGGGTLPAMQQQQQGPVVQLNAVAGCGGQPGSASPKCTACDHVVPELDAKLAGTSLDGTAWTASQQHQQQQVQQQQVQRSAFQGYSGVDCVLVPRVPSSSQAGVYVKLEQPGVSCKGPGSCLDGFAGSCGDTAAGVPGDVIDNLLSKAGEELFGLDNLEGGAAAMEQSLAGAAAAFDGDLDGDDGMGADHSSSGGGSSLCESVADELAVAGLDVDDAPSYYIFGSTGSPRQLQHCSSQPGQLGFGTCDGVVVSGDSDFAGDTGFKVAEEPCENSFAHMFDFD